MNETETVKAVKTALATALYRAVKDGATAILDSGKQVLPVALRYGDDATLFGMPLSMEDPDKARAVIAHAVAVWPVLAVITEVWTARIKNPIEFDIDTETPPSQRADRQEGVLISVFVDGKVFKTGFLLFERKKDGDKITVARAQGWIESGGAISFETQAGSVFPS